MSVLNRTVRGSEAVCGKGWKILSGPGPGWAIVFEIVPPESRWSVGSDFRAPRARGPSGDLGQGPGGTLADPTDMAPTQSGMAWVDHASRGSGSVPASMVPLMTLAPPLRSPLGRRVPENGRIVMRRFPDVSQGLSLPVVVPRFGTLLNLHSEPPEHISLGLGQAKHQKRGGAVAARLERVRSMRPCCRGLERRLRAPISGSCS